MTISWNGAECDFVVEDDTLNGVLNSILLINEINAAITSADATSINVDYNDQTGKNDAKLFFDSEPTSGDKTTVESTIAAHAGTQSTKDAQKWTSNTEQNTTNTSWFTVMQEETSPLRAGEWQFDLSLELKAADSSFSSAAKARLVAQKLGGSVNDRAQWASNIQLYDGKGARIPFTAEEADKWEFALQISQAGGTTAYIQRMRVSLTYSGPTVPEA